MKKEVEGRFLDSLALARNDSAMGLALARNDSAMGLALARNDSAMGLAPARNDSAARPPSLAYSAACGLHLPETTDYHVIPGEAWGSLKGE